MGTLRCAVCLLETKKFVSPRASKIKNTSFHQPKTHDNDERWDFSNGRNSAINQSIFYRKVSITLVFRGLFVDPGKTLIRQELSHRLSRENRSNTDRRLFLHCSKAKNTGLVHDNQKTICILHVGNTTRNIAIPLVL